VPVNGEPLPHRPSASRDPRRLTAPGRHTAATDQEVNAMCRVLNKHKAGVPAGAVYIGRGSKWGNPFRIGPFA
jgi:hypothetical protein